MGKSLILKKVSFGFVTGAISLVIDSLVGLSILPLLLKFLSKDIAGLWVFFMSFTGIVLLGQAGLAPVVIRLSAEIKEKREESRFFDNIWSNITHSFLVATFLVLLICGVLYFAYIREVLIKNNFLVEGTYCWIFLSLGNALRIYGIKYLHIINGLGEVGWDKVVKIMVSVTTLSGYYLVLKLNFGFKALGLSFLVSSALFYAASWLLFERFNKGVFIKRITKPVIAQLKYFFKESGKILVLNLTSFFVMQSDIFIIERLAGLKIIPYYSGLSRIVTIVIAVSSLATQLIYPFIAQKYAAKDYDGLRKLYYKNVIVAILISFAIGLPALLLAPYVVPLWLGKGGYLGSTLFGLMLLLGVIYAHHNAHASSIIATGTTTFMGAAICNAVLSLSLAIVGGMKFGMIGIVAGNILGTIIPSIYVVTWSLKFIKKLK
ncbi:lipopolysaccharide biosynthesis protein [Mucilaginibacter sp. P25]|uniref:Membrane protein involved in the export of O-antigen and teichoic acid n=1 Tax=Mucilaginibacter gossypii TaxID=551996 RepID=A0A1G7WE29_9SPHI|nr:hypothetical protein [Mucilaginibacter gossypii]SDG70232.1 Membrane protein involved in the export of O-antigen and teichoic acid [Mucilaginibacter gossypii]